MHRFFVAPKDISHDTLIIRDELLHQIKHVLRFQRDEQFVVLDNTGWEYHVRLSNVSNETAEAIVENRTLSPGEPLLEIILYQSLIKTSKFEFVLQKGTELGVSKFVPIICQRCVASETAKENSHKFARWQKIVQEAAEQSGRGKLPVLLPPMAFERACATAQGLRLLAWEGEKQRSLKSAIINHTIPGMIQESKIPLLNLFIGPEGGFSISEVELAHAYDLVPISLGQRPLRAETAALVAISAILYELDELEPAPIP